MTACICRCALIVACVAGVTGCEQQDSAVNPGSAHVLQQWVGRNVIVQFRRDALGACADLPVGPETDSINGAATSIGGELVSVHADSVVIERQGAPHWIPRDVILHVRVNP